MILLDGAEVFLKVEDQLHHSFRLLSGLALPLHLGYEGFIGAA
jgi:hypothetical protein